MEHWKKDLLCPVCGKEFKGTAKATMCSPTCRTRLRRMLEAGQKPEFYTHAKLRGQKIPDIEKRLKTPIKPYQLSYDERMTFNENIKKQIEELKTAPPPGGMNIRLWWQKRDAQIEELKKKLK